MRKAEGLLKKLNKKKDPGPKKATDQVSKLQNFDFDYIEGEKKYKKFNEKEKVDVGDIIKELIETSWGGTNAEQAKAIQLLRGLAFSDDPRSNKFMDKLNKFTSDLDPKEFK